MLAETFTERQFARLKPFVLEEGIVSIESDLFMFANKGTHYAKLLKRYKNTSGEYFGNKLLTINSLIENKALINMEQLVFPEKLAVVNKEVVGFTMKLIENNTNLSILLKDEKIPVSKKVKWLKQVGCILYKIQHIKSLDSPFLLADIHESNFILNHDTNKIMCVDLDGCKISNNKVYTMKYGTFNEKFFDLPYKYPLDEDDRPIPNFNTEWYCYAQIILNMIGNGPINRFMLHDFYDYIQHLKDVGFSQELLDYFANLYTNQDNYPPMDLLELIPKNLSKASFDSFVDKTDLKLIYKQPF